MESNRADKRTAYLEILNCYFPTENKHSVNIKIVKNFSFLYPFSVSKLETIQSKLLISLHN